jgi:choline dehydrogenase-like flavoprotein
LDVPGVGKNLQEHFNLPLVMELERGQGFFGHDQYLKQGYWLIQYLLNRAGPLTSTFGEAGGFVKTSPALNRPDVQIHLMAAPILPHGTVRVRAYGITIGSNVLRPRSVGTVSLQDSNPSSDPLIDPRFLTHQDDIERGIAGLEFAREITRAPALSKFVRRELLPGPEVKSKDDMISFAREWGKMDYHPVGTCKMGDDELAVVDQRLRLHGSENIRVCDSSIMPTQISGNTNSPTIMIAERAAEFIASA